MFVASKVLFMMTKQKTVETINTCDSFGTSKIQNIFFYGISICDKPSSIVNIKEGIIYDDRRNSVDTINTCDGLCASKIKKFIFFMVLLFATNMIPS